MRITAIERQKRRPRVNISADGRFVLPLSLALAAEAGLRVGEVLTPERLEDLRRADERQQAHDAALRLLAYRPRSEAEMRFRLARRGLPPAAEQMPPEKKAPRKAAPRKKAAATTEAAPAKKAAPADKAAAPAKKAGKKAPATTTP